MIWSRRSWGITRGDFFIIDDPVGQPTSQGARAVIWRWYQEYLRGEGDRSDAGRGTQ